jgi:hypothetical protein
MIINDLNIPGFASGPEETNAPLIVDADAILTAARTLEFFESISRDSLHFILSHLLSALPV